MIETSLIDNKSISSSINKLTSCIHSLCLDDIPDEPSSKDQPPLTTPSSIPTNPCTPLTSTQVIFNNENNPSTPKTSKMHTTTSHHLIKSKKKKAKRRKCTPIPQQLPTPPQTHSNSKKTTKRFVDLFTSSLQESSNDPYLSLLCSDSTPSHIFTNLFVDCSENPEKVNVIGEGIYNEIKTCVKIINEGTYLEEEKNCEMKVLVIKSDFTFGEVDMRYFMEKVVRVDLEIDEAVVGVDCKIYIPGKIEVMQYEGFCKLTGVINENKVQKNNARFCFKISEIGKRTVLSSIEVQCF